MALQVWLPLNKNGDLKNQGLADVTVTNNGATYNSSGKIGGCYTGFNTGFMSLNKEAMSTLSGEFTISCWVKINSYNSNYQTVWSGCSTSSSWNNMIMVLLRNGNGSNLIFCISNNSSATQSSCSAGAIELGNWMHITCCYKPGHIITYKNGILVLDYATSITPNVSTIKSCLIGRDYGAYPNDMNINDFRIYNHCLSEDEIHELSLGKVGHWCLDENSFITKNTAANHINFSNITNYESGYTSISDCEIGGKKIVITNKLSWCGAVLSVPITETGTYTLSVYCKPISRSSTAINLTLYFSGCGYSDSYTTASWSNPGTWQRISLVKNFQQTGTLTIYLICYGGSRNSSYTISAEYCKLLVEKMPTPSNYSLTNTAPIFKDISGNHYDLTVNGNPTLSDDSVRYNKSTLFNGSNYLSCTSPTTEAKTLSLWAYIGSIPTSSSVLFADYKSKLSLGFYNSGTLLITRCGGTSATLGTISSLIKTNAWNHFCVVNGTTNLLYINGLAATMSGSNNWTHSTDTLMIGMRSAGTGFANKISDVRLYATALSADDVLKLYKLGNV